MGDTKRRICVVLVIDDLGFGGAERQVVELANNMDSNCYEVHICSLSDHLPLRNQLKDFEDRLHIITRKGRFDFTVVPRLARLLRKLNADIVHGYMFSAEIASRLAGRMAGTELVIGSERNANRLEIGKINILAHKLTHKCVDIIIANSKAGAEYNGKIFGRPSSDYRVVHNGVNIERFRPIDGRMTRQKMGIPFQCPVFGAFANFKKQKNHSMLFRAFERVLAFLPEARLLLVGDQPTDSRGRLNNYRAQLDRLVKDLMIGHRCIFLGHQDHTEHLYPVCDITVLSSLHEGTPNVLLESMACGVPVVATNVCDNSYVVKDGQTGFLVELDDVEGMGERLRTLMADDAMRQKMGREARNWVAAEFSLSQLARRTEAAYLEGLNRKRNKRKGNA